MSPGADKCGHTASAGGDGNHGSLGGKTETM